MAKASDRFAVVLQVRVAEVSHSQVRDAAECWALKLNAAIILSLVRCYEEEAVRGLGPTAKGQVEQPYNARVDGRGMLDLEGRRHFVCRPIEPEYIDKSHGVGAWTLLERTGQYVEASVAKATGAERSVTVVRRDPYRVAEAPTKIP